MSTKLRDGLVSWYDFVCNRAGRNNIYDFSGNKNDLIIADNNNIAWDGNENIILTNNVLTCIGPSTMISSESIVTLHFRIALAVPGLILFKVELDTGTGFYLIGRVIDSVNTITYCSFVCDVKTGISRLYKDGIFVETITGLTFPTGKVSSLVFENADPITFGDFRFYDRGLSDEEIYNLVYRKTFIDESGRVYSKSFNTDQVITPKIKETGLDYLIFDGTKLGVNLSETTLECNDIEGI